jgi:hypothetical protein
MRRQKIAAITFTVLVLMIITVPLVAADSSPCSDAAHTIKVWPAGTTASTGMPIVTGTPANLFILHTGQGPINNVWLLIVINKPTYDNLDKITIDAAEFLNKNDFRLVTPSKLPPTAANATTGYPGTTWQYTVSAIKSSMNETGNPVYYAVKYFLPEITTVPTSFTLAVELTAPASIKALILGLGRYDPPKSLKSFGILCDNGFNRFTSYSKGTLVVPEAATIALALSPFAGLGLYTVRRRRK